MKRSIGARTLIYPNPVLIIGTYDAEGNPNAMTAAWGGICSSNPPSVAFSIQKSRCTYENLMETRVCTISIPSEDFVREADYFGIVSGKKTDKFKATGLTPLRSDLVNAPFVGEFPVVIECRVTNSIEIGVHTQFICEILDVKIDEAAFGSDGKPDMTIIRPFMYDAMKREYRGIGALLAPAFSAGSMFPR
jgi:flavin reductase (DIM6/NTAB) family NADH-FMN oxidoreductase RutF